MIYIWIRSTLDWENEAAFKAQLSSRLVDAVELWNRTFNIPYHLFRHRLRQIAHLNHTRVDGAKCTEWEAIPDGNLVVPVDDDDWFAPGLATTLAREQEEGISAYFWPSNFLEVPVHLQHQAGRIRRTLFPSTPNRFLCTTNNYAMVKGPEIQALLRKHTHASLWFESNMNSAVKEIGEPLSIMNRTLGSVTSLAQKRPPFAREKLLLGLHRYRHVYSKRASPELAWSQLYREMMAALIQELY